jgi:hypothetical protein
MKTNNYYWNEETINHFKFESSYITKEETIENIERNYYICRKFLFFKRW